MRQHLLQIIILISIATYAEGLRIGVDGGISEYNVFGTDQWNTGLVFGGSVFYAPADNISFGIRVAYNRWSPDADSFVNMLPADLADPEITGSGTVWEIVPALRIATNISGSQVGFFGHFGAGLFLISTDVQGEGTLEQTPFSRTISDSSQNVWGISLGLGISIGRFSGFGLEILPIYQVLDINNVPRQYYTVTLGISYEF